MLRLATFLLTLCGCFLLFSACGTSPSGKSGASPADAQAAAQDALNRMDGGGQSAGSSGGSTSSKQATAPSSNNKSSTNASSAQQGANVNTGKNKPAWVDSVDSVYNRNQYVAALGTASDRTMSERNALANLTGIFGQSIYADQTIVNTYNESVKSGVTTGWTDNIAMQNIIRTAASMDTLVGAEVREVWADSKNTWFAVAVMEKARTTQIYTEMINANKDVINNLITMSQAQKNSLEGYSRYQFAATVADINTTYGNLLQVIGAPLPAGMLKGDIYRIEAQNITKTIPVGIRIRTNNDKAGRIQGAFAKSLSELGFRSGGNNSPYLLDVSIVTSPVEYPNNVKKYTRIEVDAKLTEDGVTLLPYNFADRDGHTNQSEADNRAYMLAERTITGAYPKILNDYLSQLIPVRK